jgi:glutamate synthase domain-containing protein 3
LDATTTHPPSLDIDCSDLTTRSINRAIRDAIDTGTTSIRLLHPSARHNLGVALQEGIHLSIQGSAGYYVGGLNDGATIEVHGSAGWGAAESMRDGTVVIDGDVGNAVAASIRAGTVVVRGNASTRAGIAMKGGLLLVAGNVGPMAAFMMQKGTLIVCGDADDGLADSMYAGTVLLAGRHKELGGDAVEEPISAEDRRLIEESLATWDIPRPAGPFRKFVAGRKLWNFQQSEIGLWRSAL